LCFSISQSSSYSIIIITIVVIIIIIIMIMIMIRAPDSEFIPSFHQPPPTSPNPNSLARLRRQAEALRRSTLTTRRLLAWDAWRGQLAALRTVQRFRQRGDRARLRQLLFAWAKWSHGQQRRRAASLREARRETKRKAFAEWRGRVLRTRRLRAAGERVAEAGRRWRLRRAMFSGWQEVYKAARDERAAQRQFLLRRGLRPWLAAVQQRKEEQRRGQVVAVTHARRIALASLIAWAEAHAEAARLRTAAMHHARRLLHRRWVLAAHPRRLAEATAATEADGARSRGQLRRALAGWREHVDRRRRLRLAAQGRLRVGVHWAYWRRWVGQRRAWAAWRERVLRWSVDRPHVYEAVVGLVPSGSKRLALSSWVAFYARRVEEREAVAAAAVHHARAMAFGAVRRLGRHARDTRAARAAAQERVAEAERAYARSRLRCLREGAVALKAVREAETERRRLRRFLRAWAEHARHMKMARAWLRESRQRGAALA
jgi:hypothetical protein